jgi:hypothetical protein
MNSMSIITYGRLFNARSMIKNNLLKLFSAHLPNGSPDVFIFSSPRSGSTWLMEMIMSQPGFKYCDEPFNLRTFAVRKQLGLSKWRDVLSETFLPDIEKYIESFRKGRPCHVKLKHGLPFYRYYRPVTHRIVFKIIHAGEDRMAWFENTFNAHIAYLLRHPIPVSLSRLELPRLHAFLEGEYCRYFSARQLKFSKRILENGTKMQRGVLIWCLQNMVPLHNLKSTWAVLTYEQLVMNPVPVIHMLCQKLDLPDSEKMLKALPVPSVTTWQSDRETRRVFSRKGERRNNFLIEKWRRKIDEREEKQLMSILELFDIDIYKAGSDLPSTKFWIQ